MDETPQKLVFTKAQIQEAVERLAKEIAFWTEDSGVKGLNLVSILKGAKPFTRDLSAALKKRMPSLGLKFHEVHVKGTDGTKLLKDRQLQSSFPTAEVLGADPLLIVDDLVDSGLTLKLLKREMELLSPGPVKTAVLIRKFDQAGSIDFCGFDMGLDLRVLAEKGIKDYWLYGYGMDLDGSQRDLDYIGWVAIK